jgi:hypothetical protein
MSAYENIKVICRFRPANKFEEDNSELSSIKIIKNQSIECEDVDAEAKSKVVSFTFDYIFGKNEDQIKVY